MMLLSQRISPTFWLYNPFLQKQRALDRCPTFPPDLLHLSKNVHRRLRWFVALCPTTQHHCLSHLLPQKATNARSMSETSTLIFTAPKNVPEVIMVCFIAPKSRSQWRMNQNAVPKVKCFQDSFLWALCATEFSSELGMLPLFTAKSIITSHN
jgi:hypothetical protein